MIPVQQGRLPFIDVLRAIAIGTVLFRHLPPELGVSFGKLHEWGGRGVDLFFILSGFLIGTTCLERAARFEHRPFRQAGAYWLLRSARIFPLYFSLLGLFALGLPLFHPDVIHVIRNHPLPFLTFTSNYFGQGTLELGIYWSLAIEEQFYLAVGLLVLATSSRRDTLAAAFLGLSLITILVAVFYRHEIAQAAAEKTLEESRYVFRLFHSTLARMDQLAIGLVSAVVSKRFNLTPIGMSTRWADGVTWAAVLSAIAMLVWFPHRAVLGFLYLGLAFAAAVLIAQRPAARFEPKGWRRLLFTPLGSIGKLSFGLYLFHPLFRPLAIALSAQLGLASSGLPAATAFLTIWLALTWGAAWLSFRFFEDPIIQFARGRASKILARVAWPPGAATETKPAAILAEAEGRTEPAR